MSWRIGICLGTSVPKNCFSTRRWLPHTCIIWTLQTTLLTIQRSLYTTFFVDNTRDEIDARNQKEFNDQNRWLSKPHPFGVTEYFHPERREPQPSYSLSGILCAFALYRNRKETYFLGNGCHMRHCLCRGASRRCPILRRNLTDLSKYKSVKI